MFNIRVLRPHSTDWKSSLSALFTVVGLILKEPLLYLFIEK